MQLISDKRSRLYMRCDSGLLDKTETLAEKDAISLEDEIEMLLFQHIFQCLNTKQLCGLLFKQCAPIQARPVEQSETQKATRQQREEVK